MGSNPHLLSCAWKTATLGPELQVSMGPRPRSFPSNRITSQHESQPTFVVFERKTETLGPELQVSVGPRLHLWLCAWKTACLPPNLQVSLGPRPRRFLSNRITSQHESQPTFVDFEWKTETLGPELQVSMCPRPHLSFCACKPAWLSTE